MRNRTLLWGLGLASIFTIFCGASANALTVTEDYTLTEDIAEQVYVTGDGNISINMNGHSIVAPAYDALYIKGAKVTLTGTGAIESKKRNGVSIVNGGSLTMGDGISIKSQEFGVFTADNATFTMNGGTIETVDNCGVGGNGSANYKGYTININGGTINANITSGGYVSCGVYHPNAGTVNMAGGTINSSNGAGIVQRAGVLIITGGTINAHGTSTGKVGDSRVAVKAAAVVVDKEANYPEVATLSSKVSSEAVLNGDYAPVQSLGDATVELTGGIYNDEPAEGTIPEGYAAYQVINGDDSGKWIVVKESTLKLKVIADLMGESDVEEADRALIEEAIKDKYTLAGYYNILLAKVTEDGQIVGFVEEADSDMLVEVKLPGDLAGPEDGYERKFVIVRVHGGKADLIEDVTDGTNGAKSFKSNLFSTYALAYVDTKKATPAAGDTDDSNTPAAGDTDDSNTSEGNTTPAATTDPKTNGKTPETPKTAKANKNNVANPNTGDKISDYYIMMLLSLFGLGYVFAFKKAYGQQA